MSPSPALPLLSLVALLALPASAGAVTLLFDFGTTPAGGTTVVNATAAPVLGGPAGLTGSLTYNVISGTDNGQSFTGPSVFQSSSGVEVPGISISYLTGAANSAWISMTGTSPYSRVGISAGRSGIGVFATPASPNNTNLFSDFISSGNGSGHPDYLGVSIAGIPAGTYTVFVVSNVTYNQSAGALTRTLRAGAGTAGLTDFSSVGSPTTLSYDYTNIAADTASWAAAEGKYWTSFEVTISASSPVLHVGGFRSGDNQGGTFNSIQIVEAIPEPSTVAALAAAAVFLVTFLVRRRRA